MTNRRIKKEAIFKLGVNAIQCLTKKVIEGYICPICGIEFPINSLDDGTLTLEHVPPRKMGGKELVLTCKKCNNNAGHGIESDLCIRQELHNFKNSIIDNKNDYRGRIKLGIGEEMLNADISKSQQCINIKIHGPSNNPQKVQKSLEYIKKLMLEKKCESQEVKIRSDKSYNFRKAKVADLRIAFLVVFAKLGYKYALDPRLIPVRKQIFCPDSDLLQDKYWMSIPETHSADNLILVVDEPFNSLIVKIGYSGVILPPLEGPFDFYSNLCVKTEGMEKINFKGGVVSWPVQPEFLIDLKN